ncbi:myb-like protein M [Gordionus sp. m RMFG-2023]|uniref:myb-like protein M n=1 Tax=Gordionus sp. m RMFG-2023 TaxID=3053472 RepID=UPI0031FD69D3
MGKVKNSYVTTKPIQDSHAHGKSLIKQSQFINDNHPAQHFDERYDLRCDYCRDKRFDECYDIRYDNDRDKRFNGRHSNFHDNRFDQSYDNCHNNRNRFDNRNDNYYDDRYNNSGYNVHGNRHDSYDHHQSPDRRDDCYRGDNRTNYSRRG